MAPGRLDVVAVQTVLLLAVPFDRDVLGSGPILPDDVPGSVSALVGVAAVTLEPGNKLEDDPEASLGFGAVVVAASSRLEELRWKRWILGRSERS